MSTIKRLLFSPGAINSLMGFGLIIAAYLFEVIGNFEPCPLCILQRWSFGLIGICGIILLVLPIQGLIQKLILFLAGIFALGGGTIAARQIYLQHLPKDQIPSCAPPMDFLMDTLPFLEVIQTILLGDGNCAETQWRFIFNFAEWALLAFIGLVAYNLYFIFIKR